MKDVLSSALLWSGAALLVVACGDQKGFEARRARPEDALIKEFRALSKQEQTDVANWAKVRGNFQKALVQPSTVPSGAPQAGTDAGAYVEGVQRAQGQGSDGAAGGQRASVQGEPMRAEVRASGQAPDQAQLDDALATQVAGAKIQEISAVAALNASETVKGLELFVEQGEKKGDAAQADAAINLKAESYMTFDGKDFFVLGQGQLTLNDQYSALKLVELKVKAKDQFHNDVEIKGVEMYASCLSVDSKSCEQIIFMILVTAGDGKKTGVISTWAVTGQNDGRLKVMSSSLGDKIQTVREAQEKSAGIQGAAQGTAAPTGVVGGSDAGAVQRVEINGRRMSREQERVYDEAQARVQAEESRDNDAGYFMAPKAGAEDDMTGVKRSEPAVDQSILDARDAQAKASQQQVQRVEIVGKRMTPEQKIAYDKEQAKAEALRDNDSGYFLAPKAGAEDDMTGLKRAEPAVDQTVLDARDAMVKAARGAKAQAQKK